MSKVFDWAVDIIIRVDGGQYSDDPNDPSSERSFGISKRSFPKEDIWGLTCERAVELYRTHYWEAIRGDDLPPSLALIVFDGAIEQTIRAAIVDLQQALRVPTDGIMGPVTLITAQHAGGLLGEIIVEVLARRAVRYAQSPVFAVWGKSWMRRLFLVYQAVRPEELVLEVKA